MKLYIILAAVLSQSVFSKCPSACNGHGTCNIHDQCTCFTEDSAGFIYLSSTDNSCFKHVTETPCNAEANCKWDTDGVCKKTCFTHTTETLCAAAATCGWDTDGSCKIVVKDDVAFKPSTRYGSTAHAEWTGADCSRRTCPRSTSWTEVGNDEVGKTHSCTHKPEVECSDQGLCDRATGLCECFPGYTGSACQRTECPDDCSGHGTCRSNRDFAYDFAIAKTHQMLQTHLSTEKFQENYVVTYDDAWDTNHLYGCLCDRGYRGPSCSQVECPSSNDPLDDKCDLNNVVGESGGELEYYHQLLKLGYTDDENSLFIENFQIQKFAATGASGWTAAYTTSTSAEQQDDLCDVPANIADTTGEAACKAVTGKFGEKCLFTAKNGTAVPPVPATCVQVGDWLSIAPGDINNHFYNGKVYACFGAMSGMDCSGRGICDYTKGQCSCFPGYSGTACNIIEELA